MGNKLLSRPGRALLALLVVALTPVTLGAATTSANAASTHNWRVLVGSQTKSMSVQGERFLPGDITIDAGDSVTWRANAAEIHTVTFFHGGQPQTSVPPLDPTDPNQVTRQGPATMDSTSYFNSGLLTLLPDAGPLKPLPVYTSYRLTFPDVGTFSYYCLVHGVMMRGVVHVQPAGSAYPVSQAQIDEEAAVQARAMKLDGLALRSQARAASGRHKVFMGADDGFAMVMRFIHHKVVIHKGQRVRFVNTMSVGAPHTVTFGTLPQGPAIFQPKGNPSNFKGGNLHSGLMTPGSKFIVTFKKVGRFHYVCALHHDMGMRGLVVVKR